MHFNPFEHYHTNSLDDLYFPEIKQKESFDVSELNQATNITENVLKGKIMKVLVLYIGGSFGMINTNNGLVYKRNLFDSLLRSNLYLHDSKYALSEDFSEFLITPETAFKTRIMYKIEEFEEMLDSSDINDACYVKLSEKIELNYENYEGFVILQGPPTITYTASALSFMLENLDKPVILTGSQLPLCMMRNDAFTNFLNSLTIAAHFNIPEVMILFHDKLFRGNRCTIFENSGFDCVSSPNFPHLAHLQSNIEVAWDLIVKRKKKKKFSIFKGICSKIAHIKLQPLCFLDLLETLLKTEDLKALIIESYGQGKYYLNEEKFSGLIKNAISRGIVVVNISQCYRYNIKPSVEFSELFSKSGVICGGDMTSESLFAKLSYLIGKNFSFQEISKYLIKNLRGELTPTPKNVFSYQEDTLLVKLHDALHRSSQESISLLEKLVLPNILLHMTQKGYLNFIQDLYDNGINISESDFEGRTALHIAARENDLNIIKFLLEKSEINADQMDNSGKTALYEALACKNKKIVYELKNAGATNFGKKPLVVNLLFKSQFVKNNDLEAIKIAFYGGLKNLAEFQDQEKRNISHLVAFF